MILFDTVGPFRFNPFKYEKRSFWEEVKQHSTYIEDLETAKGCYLVCRKTDKTVKPFYVGKTFNKAGFKAEIFTPRNLNNYKNLGQHRYGVLEMILFPNVTKNRKVSTNEGEQILRAIDWFEVQLIQYAIERNPRLLNIANAKLLERIFVRGVKGQYGKMPTNTPAKYVRDDILNLTPKS